MKERLQKIIARAGIASRREAEDMIQAGRVTVNGRAVTRLGSKADDAVDHIKVDGRLITRSEPHRYILLNKPKEVMSTVSDPEGRLTVLDLIRGVRERIYPVGRLDYHSEGLLLLTNDGDFAFTVAHPSHGAVKTYHVKVRGVPAQRSIDKLQRGITIDGRRTLPCEIERLRTTGRSNEEGNSWFEVRLREGRTQQIRKMFQAMGHPVSKLRRVAIGQLHDKSLDSGQWRELTPQEVKRLLSRKEPRPRRPRAGRRTSSEERGTKSHKRGVRSEKRGARSERRGSRRSSLLTPRTS
jgi:23S rRNA pseudouridine2605 synthase